MSSAPIPATAGEPGEVCPDPERALRRVRSFIADRLIGSPEAPITIGDVALRPHQQRAVRRVRGLIARHGGALLADATGLGKTFVALAVASEYARVAVVAPASLRAMWERALAGARVRAAFTSVERLSRGPVMLEHNPDLVVFDEAHHLRTPRAKRYANAALLCDGARVLLLTATPIQNRRDDLAAQLALFLGDVAWTMDDDALARFVVRQRGSGGAGLPALDDPRWLATGDADDAIVDDLLALPAPVPAADEGDGGALVACSLLRQWASSRAALVAALRRRLARATAMIASLESGRMPTRREIAAWTFADDAIQLAFAELLAGPTSGQAGDSERWLAAVRTSEGALRELLARLRRSPDSDLVRAEALRQLRARHPGARIVAFSQHAETVRGLARLLINDGGVAELTARGARTAGGRLARRDVLSQLSPCRGAGLTPRAEIISLLLATDVLSEGLDLHAASVVVHLDLPWNPARLEQRVGRVRRMGSAHATVFTYALAPPASAEHLLRVEARLRAKLGVAHDLVAVGGPVIPMNTSEPLRDGRAEISTEVLSILERWRGEVAPSPHDSDADTGHRAAVKADRAGFLALVTEGDSPLLVAGVDDAISCDARLVADRVQALDGVATTADSCRLATALAALERWGAVRRAGVMIGLGTTDAARVRARLRSRIEGTLAGAPRHRRAEVAALASSAHRVTRLALNAGAERALARLVDSTSTGDEWLRSVAHFVDSRATTASGLAERDAAVGVEVLALVLFVADD